MNLDANRYIIGLEKWKAELTQLRQVILDCGLTEGFKWKHPCYIHLGKNILLIHEFKDYCGIMFFKGALLKDQKKVLIQQTANMQSARQLRFTSIEEITSMEVLIRQYVAEAIDVEKAGLKIKKKATSDYELSEELEQSFTENPAFKAAFYKLTAGRQRGYLLHFSSAKQTKTKISRIENSMTRIYDGYGLNDCTCGLSLRKPNCDGSHKQLEVGK